MYQDSDDLKSVRRRWLQVKRQRNSPMLLSFALGYDRLAKIQSIRRRQWQKPMFARNKSLDRSNRYTTGTKISSGAIQKPGATPVPIAITTNRSARACVSSTSRTTVGRLSS